MSQLIINKHHILGACELKLEVFQELSGGKETHSIGSLTVNLAEYAGSGVTTRRYLLDQCKFNSTVKLSIRMNQKSDVGTHFQVPPAQKSSLNTADNQVDRTLGSDERSVESIATTTDHRGGLHASAPVLKKSHSAMSLPNFCKQNTPFSSSEEPSPTDLVEQLFTRKNSTHESLQNA